MPAQKKKQNLKEKILQRHLEAKEKFVKKHAAAHKFFQEKNLDLGRVREHSTKLLAAGTLASSLLLASPQMPMPSLPSVTVPYDWAKTLTDAGLVLPEDSQNFLIQRLKEVLPNIVCPLPPEAERQISFLIERLTGIKARASLEGERLLTCYGLIGAEQHLPRFPGDTVSLHDEFLESGITPGLGAWGYFVSGKNQMTKEDVMREKYYVAVQTLYLPDWNTRFPYLRDWYKYRKVLALNPKTGKAVVAVIADAGPAAWTGKQFGGSPEVMHDLDLDKGMRKGPVLLFFVDDPENKVPLGPVYWGDTINLPKVEIKQE